MNKEELKNKLLEIRKELGNYEKHGLNTGHRFNAVGIHDGITKSLELFEELDEIKLPEINDRQATYLKKCKEYGIRETDLIKDASMDCDMHVLKLVRERPLDLLLAYKYGYAIEPEKKMLVTIKSYDQTESEFEIPESEAKKLIEELRGKRNEQ